MIVSTTSAGPKLHTVHALRAIAALCVTMLHLYAVEHLSTESILPSRMELARVGTDLFFVVSGAVLAFSTATRTHRPNAAASFLYDRISRIMPLYWFVTVLVLVAWSLSGGRLLATFIGHPEFWSTAFLLPSEVRPAIPVAWSLTHLLLFYFVFALTLMTPKKFEWPILGFWALLVVALRFAVGDHASLPVIGLIAHPSALEFIAGIAIMRFALSGRKLSAAALGGASLMWFAFVSMFAGPHPDINTFKDENVRLLTLGISAILIVATAVSYDFAKPRAPNKVFRFLGDASFGIYLGHCLTIALVARMWSKFERPGPVDNIIAIICMLALSIGFGWALHRVVEMPLRRLTSAAKPHVFAALSKVQLTNSVYGKAP